jgi:hypothetical protein
MKDKKEPRLTPLQSALGHLLNRVEDLERKPAPAQPTLEELFLDRSDEATRLLGNFVYDHAPVPPALPDRSFANWLLTAALCVTVVAGGLVFMALENRVADLRKELVALEQDITKLDARAAAPLSGDLTGNQAVLTIDPMAPITVTPPAHATDIFLDIDQKCWLQVTDGDGKVLSADFVPAGRREAAPGAKMPLTIRDGCPGHVAFTVDGAPVDPPREPGHDPAKVEVVVLGGATVKPQSYIYIVPEERKPCSGRCA